ncbi:TetR/AcrR family transcriptional regulator [Nocardia sp. NPDC058499]|uniref:TetR/AcrR family transcriptional regulator n=1 Tax=Nocardia sp. NPDC058499 TaxID=3346530 RepID=UPI0036591C85
MSAQRRELLVRTAAGEFTSAGYEQASLNRIIARCGLSKSSFYHMVSSKRELFEIVVGDLAAALTVRLSIPEPEAFAGPAFWDRIDELIGRLGELSLGDDAFLALGRLFYLSGTPDATITRTLARIEEWLHRVLLIGRDSGAVRDDLPVALQSRLVVAVLRALDEWSVQHAGAMAPAELEELLHAQVRTVRRLLEAG